MIWSEVPVYAIKTVEPGEEPRHARWRRRSSRRTSSPTRTTRRCSCGRSPTSCPRAPARRRRTTSRTPSARPRRSTRAAPSASRSPATRRSAARRPTRRSTSSASTSTSAGTPARRARSSTARSSPAYLDQVRNCYPEQAVMITEFGAEANRDGPVEEKGTWAFQQDFVNFHLATYASKGWLSGALYWALNEFKVRPGWEGGNPRPNPPVHQKGLLQLRRLRAQAGVGGAAPQLRGDKTVRLARGFALGEYPIGNLALWASVPRLAPDGRATARAPGGAAGAAAGRAGARASAGGPWAAPRRAAAGRPRVRSWVGPGAGRCRLRRRRRPRPAASTPASPRSAGTSRTARRRAPPRSGGACRR